MKFRKKPVEIEAIQFTPENEHWDWNTLTEFFGSNSGSPAGTWRSGGNKIYIYTLEGTMEAYQGDWIIKGVEGEFYPCKNSIFEQTYERVYG